MPKKAKKGKKGKGKGKKSKKSSLPSIQSVTAGPTDVEISLRLELEDVEKELVRVRDEAERARRQKEILEKELEAVQADTKEYEIYMAQWVEREKNQLDGLADRQQREIDAIEADKRQITSEIDRKKAVIRDEIFELENELEKVEQQIMDLADYDQARSQQLQELSTLESAISELEVAHEAEMEQLRHDLLQDKLKFQEEARQNMKKLEEEAAQEALALLGMHEDEVKQQNVELRKRLLKIIAENKQLKKHEDELKKHRSELDRMSEFSSGVDRKDVKVMKATLSRRSSLEPLRMSRNSSLGQRNTQQRPSSKPRSRVLSSTMIKE